MCKGVKIIEATDINETLKATIQAITKEEEQLDLKIIEATEQKKLNKLQEEKQEFYLNETRGLILKNFQILDTYDEKIKIVSLIPGDLNETNLAIIEIYNLDLGINLGTNDNTIFFNFVFKFEKDESIHFKFLDMPIFNYEVCNDILLDKLNNIFNKMEKTPLDMSVSPIISKIKQIKIKITNNPIEAKDVYDRYIKTLDTIINLSNAPPTTGGGRKKRIIKSKKDITKNKNSKKPKRRSKKTI